jgi:hypothetical protein
MSIDSKIKNSKGYAIEQKINQFFLTKYTFKHNYLELQKHLSDQLQPETAFRLAYAQHNKELEAIQLETIRYLHNFIASALSLIDHTRVFQRRLFTKDDAFTTEYQAKIDELFVTSPLAAFIVSFRQYVQHYQSPMIANVSNLVDKAEDMQAKVVIAKADLLDFSKWTAPAKKFIHSLDNELDVVKTTDEYYQLVIGFHGWFEKRQTEIFRAELDELNALKKLAINEQLKTIVNHFAKLDDIDNTFFITNVTRHFSSDQQAYYDKVNAATKITFLIWVLNENNLIASKEDEQAIRTKLTY